MKKILSIGLLVITFLINAQVIIGDGTGTAPADKKTSVLMEFAAGQNKGIIVPYVRTTLPTASASNRGTILLDSNDPTNARMKYSNGTSWVDLSGQPGNVASALTSQPTTTSAPETDAKKTVITDLDLTDTQTSALPEGVLVLESYTKAMLLPTVDDVQSILSPSPGMMVYVKKVGFKRLAVFNGTIWSFWKP